jgi:Na+/H+-dicarboxylate symporter
MNRSATALGALAAGIVAGALIRAAGNDDLATLAEMVRPVGTLWLNALKMTLVPLVFAMVAKGIIALDRSHGGGRLIGLAVPLMLGLLAAAMLTGMSIGLLFEALWPVAPVTLGASGAAPTAAPEIPTIGQMLVGLVPSNPVAAASNGAMASLVVFAIVFGFAVSRSCDRGGDAVTPLLEQVAAAMLRIVDWVLLFTPIGIFALTLGLALDNGLGVAGFVARIVLESGVCAAIAILLGFAIAWIGGGIDPIRFGRAIAAAQAMAAGSCSSAATLPAMIETSKDGLGIPEAIGGSVLPLAVSIFRFAVPLYQGAIVILFMGAMTLPRDAPTLLLGGGMRILN